jgi:CheY-like chemotaxis protein
MEAYKNVLIVDDDVVSNYICNLLLKKYRIAQNIFITQDTDTGIYTFSKLMIHENLKPDLILLDINIPDKDGFRFMEEFNLRFQILKTNTRICILTNSIFEQDLQRMKNLGANYWANKPLRKEVLMNLEEIW